MKAFGGRLYRPDVAPADAPDAEPVEAPAEVTSNGDASSARDAKQFPTLKIAINNPLSETANKQPRN